MNALELLTLTKEQKEDGVWLSGIEFEGEYKAWWYDGHLEEHSSWKNHKLHGEYKRWTTPEHKLARHDIFEDGYTIKDYLKD